jgi:hypothetical protein
MREQDKLIFKQVAREKGVWILVRDTNEHSLRFIGMPQFSSKPYECKAKTADTHGRDKETGHTYDIRGLVVSAAIWPDVYDTNKRENALRIWKEFSRAYRLDAPGGIGSDGYSVEMNKNSSYYGCVKKDGNYIFGDYDLFDVFEERHAFRNLYLASYKETLAYKEELGDSAKSKGVHNVGPKYKEVSSMLNSEFAKRGVSTMIHHGSEAQYGYSYMAVHAFSPRGTYQFWDNLRTKEEYRKLKRYVAGDPFNPLIANEEKRKEMIKKIMKEKSGFH